jgi:glycosyltransferase involved in cell wall biosynthesis
MIVQVGVYPPPYGGVSIYVKRMNEYLDSKDIDNQIWDISGIRKAEKNVITMKSPFIPFFYMIKKDITVIHYNISGNLGKNYIGFFNRFFFKKRKKVLMIHGMSMDLFTKNRKLITKSLNTFDAIICVKRNDKKYLLQQGITSDIYEIPAFIPPTKQDYEIKEISEEIWNFIHNHKPIISANASKIAFYNKQDLYGIDMCVDMIARLKEEYPQIGLVFCIPEINDLRYFTKMKEMIQQKNIKPNIMFWTKPTQFYPIIIKSDIFVRPTNNDGDAVSIREALFFKTPTVASDVVSRPEGVILFKNRDIDDFIFKVKECLNNYNYHKNKLECLIIDDNAKKILEIYQKLSNFNL